MTSELNNHNLEVSQNLQRFTELIQESLSLIFDGFYKVQLQYLDQANEKLKKGHSLLEGIQKRASASSELQAEDIADIASIISNYQKIAFNLEKIGEHTRNKNREGILFTEKAVTELEELFRGVNNLLTHMNDVINTRNPVLIDYILREKRNLKKMARDFATEHEDRLIKGVCMAHSSSIYLYILDGLQDILWHLQAVVEKLKN